MKRVYLDNAASTPMDPEVVEYMIPYLRDFFGNPSSVHDHGRKLRAVIEKARKDIAALVGAAPAEIFFTSGGTEADNMAIRCSVEGMGLRHIVTTRIEHHAVTHTVEELEKKGIAVTWLNVDAQGHPDLDQLDRVLSESPKSLVSLMHANNEIGTIIDLQAVAAICERHGALLHSDTVQTMGHTRYQLSGFPIHFATASAHKFYGPKGVGFLYIRSGVKVPPLICGGSQERNMRAGTENVASIAAMAFALGKCVNSLEEKNKHLQALKDRFRKGLEDRFPGIGINGETDPEKSLPTVLNVCFPVVGEESMLLFNLDINGISASGGSACTSGSVKGSHVLAGLGLSPAQSAHSVRFSFGVQNTFEEIDFVLNKLEEFVKLPVNT